MHWTISSKTPPVSLGWKKATSVLSAPGFGDEQGEQLEDSQASTATPQTAGATIGSSIIVKNLTKETEHNFELVNPEQVDPKNGKIPLTNPIGKALEGAKEGDEVKVGPNLFKVLKLN